MIYLRPVNIERFLKDDKLILFRWRLPSGFQWRVLFRRCVQTWWTVPQSNRGRLRLPMHAGIRWSTVWDDVTVLPFRFLHDLSESSPAIYDEHFSQVSQTFNINLYVSILLIVFTLVRFEIFLPHIWCGNSEENNVVCGRFDQNALVNFRKAYWSKRRALKPI